MRNTLGCVLRKRSRLCENFYFITLETFVHSSVDQIRSPIHHIQGCDRNQTLLLPNSVDDYIGPDNPVRVVDAFVEQLDLQEAGFCRVKPKETGRPGYDPADLLKLYIYGYLNRVRSSRRLEAETSRNLEVIWLLRGLTPDFKTIADFRKDNRGAFKPVFRQFVLLCRKLELFDGGRFEAFSTDVKDRSRKSRFPTFEWRSEFFIAYGYSISWES